mmetsp:Transcript_32472/g.70317  ORF Transcript_32472/g.70317 Transcript_32472/m.70317 type:complete len:236 (-) Transcript_32472:30-737(-)
MPGTTNPQHPRRGNRRGDSGGVSHERRGGGGTIDPGEEEIIYDGDYNMNDYGDYDDDYSFSSPDHLTSGGVGAGTASTRSLFEQPDCVTPGSGAGGLDLGSVGGTTVPTRPGLGSRSSSTRSSTTTGSGSGSGQNSLSTEAAKARRRSEREEKLRQMNDAVSYASGTVAETRSSVSMSMSMSGMQGVQGMSAQQQQHDMSEIRLRSDGRDGSPNGAHTGLLHGTAGKNHASRWRR